MLFWEILGPKYGVRLHLRHIGDTTPETKPAVSQKLFDQLGSNFRFGLSDEIETFGCKMKKIQDQSAWGTG